jgi:hypothetical protein
MDTASMHMATKRTSGCCRTIDTLLQRFESQQQMVASAAPWDIVLHPFVPPMHTRVPMAGNAVRDTTTVLPDLLCVFWNVKTSRPHNISMKNRKVLETLPYMLHPRRLQLCRCQSLNFCQRDRHIRLCLHSRMYSTGTCWLYRYILIKQSTRKVLLSIKISYPRQLEEEIPIAWFF